MDTAISLYELTTRIRNSITSQLPGPYWVRAEISEGRQNSNGHYYCKFIEKNERGLDIASVSGIIWAGTFFNMRSRFERMTGQRFGAGIKVLVKVRVNFHERYGLSLLVEDIDPSYTLGDMVRRRKEIIDKLTVEGVVNLNKQLDLPRLLLRVAIITSETAAGYGDFCNHISESGSIFNFKMKLFPATMQGDKVESSVIAALNSILAETGQWDAVAIIRGGGAVSDLNGFDTYLLAANVAQYPLPIITGIGHDRDETVLDLISNVRCKTPTAVADFLIERAANELALLDAYAESVKKCATNQLALQEQRIAAVVSRLPLAFSHVIENQYARFRLLSSKLPGAVQRVCSQESSRCERLALRIEMNTQRFVANQQKNLDYTSDRLRLVVSTMLDRQRQRLESCERGIRLAAPDRVFKLGFSLTMKDGKAITDASQLKSGDKITTRFANGEVSSTVD